MNSVRLLSALNHAIAAVRTVHRVAEWLPEGELPLLARLGGILRAADA